MKPLLIFRAVAARASVRVVPEGVRRECRVQVLDGCSKLDCLFHSWLFSIHHAALHHEAYVLYHADVLQRISGDCDDVGQVAGF